MRYIILQTTEAAYYNGEVWRRGLPRHEEHAYDSLDVLARALCAASSYRHEVSSIGKYGLKIADHINLERKIFHVVTEHGKYLNAFELYKYGERIFNDYRLYRWGRTYRFWNGMGPVPYTACRRGGSSYFRRIATQAERRLNQAIDKSEPQARKKRANLPNSLDDIQKHREKNWKSQHKGKKAWDRPRLKNPPVDLSRCGWR